MRDHSLTARLLIAAAAFVCAGASSATETGSLLRRVATAEPLVLVEWDREAVRELARADAGPLRATVPLTDELEVELTLKRFRVTREDTRFVLGRKDGPDRTLDYDPDRVLLLRGAVSGRPESSAFLALGPERATGYVDLAAEGRYLVSSRDTAGEALAPGSMSVFRAAGAPSHPPDVPPCGTGEHRDEPQLVGHEGSGSPRAAGIAVGLQQLELAVETDFELFSLFGDATATADYLVMLYAQVSDIYVRDVDTRIDLVFARVWDQPDDLFNDVDPSPLSDFRNYWNSNMGSVPRDVAQLLSGRRDYPFGGQAYLSALCGPNAYSVVGYAQGFFPNPAEPSGYNFDISVTAHEIGHNAGTGHTHDAPNNLDTCQNPATTPQRGTIMSYCGQTWSGGNANRDNYFHSRIQQNMDAHIGSVICVVNDCNENGVRDSLDISGATSLDTDSNGIPDECEDCNNNSVLDDEDIALGNSTDLNGNGIPDDCEPDCDQNGIPDDKQIDDGLSTDAYGDGIPDECETDCNSNSQSDYSEIQADMTLDVDRNRVLDACQDCDGDTVIDFDELGGAHRLWVASGLTATDLREFHGSSGVLTDQSLAAVNEAQDLIVAPGPRVLVSSAIDDRVLEFDGGGMFVGNLVAPGAGGLDFPTGMVMRSDGTLLVASRDTNSVLSFNGTTGASLGTFVAAGAGGLTAPFGMTIGANGNLYVTSSTNEVLEYDGQTGSFVAKLVSAMNNGGLDQPRGLTFKADGNLLVASFGTDEVLEFEAGTGAPMGKWAQVGTATRLTQDSPWGIRVAPNGNVFVVRTGEDYSSSAPPQGHHHDHHDDDVFDDSVDAQTKALHLTNAQMYEFDIRSGDFLRTHIGGNDHGLLFPTGFDFVPGWTVDCNLNQLPDECDISSGTSQDVDLSGVPDECELDCNANGVLDRIDVIPFGSSRDCNYNLLPDECDISGGQSRDCLADGVPDECQVTDPLETLTGWTVGDVDDDATTGVWERVDPNGTSAAPEDDHTPGSGSQCFVTGQGSVGGADGENDVDGGKTTLFSPVFDLTADPDAEIAYWRWFSNGGGNDAFVIDITDDGWGTSANVETVGPSAPGTVGGWVRHSFRVADFVTTSATVQLRFVASDTGSGSVVEAAIDDLDIVSACCSGSIGEVQNVLVEPQAQTEVSWPAGDATTLFDVAGGDLSTLRLDGDAGGASCLADDVAGALWNDPRPDPLPGEGHYYLLRGQKTCGSGTYGFASPGGERIPGSDCP